MRGRFVKILLRLLLRNPRVLVLLVIALVTLCAIALGAPSVGILAGDDEPGTPNPDPDPSP